MFNGEIVKLFKMGKWCAVAACESKSRGNKSYSFPGPGERRDKWIKFCDQPKDWVPGLKARICAIHFRSEDLLGTEKHVVPKCYAVPSIIVSNLPITIKM